MAGAFEINALFPQHSGKRVIEGQVDLSLIFVLKSVWIAPACVLFALAIYLLEIFVAFVQAYVFTLLSAVFIGMAIHQEH